MLGELVEEKELKRQKRSGQENQEESKQGHEVQSLNEPWD